jgi:putative hydrolase
MLNYDLHTHSTYSDGNDSLHDNIHAAEAMGLSHIALTDHLWTDKRDWVDEVLEELKDEPPFGYKVKILKGAEAALLDSSGRISLSQEAAAKLDIVLCDMGWQSLGFSGEASSIPREQIIEKIAQCFINLCRNPLVDVIAHPFNFGRHTEIVIPPREIELDYLLRIADEFVSHNTAFEVMNNAWWWHPLMHPGEFTAQYVEIVKLFTERGVRFTISSDAHGIGSIGNLGWSKYVLEAASVPSEQIIDPDIYLEID